MIRIRIRHDLGLSTLVCLLTSLILMLVPLKARSNDLIQHTNSTAACKDSPECDAARDLAPGVSQVTHLKQGDSHWYKIILDSGQMIQISVVQMGVDVVTRVCSPAREHIVDIDDTTGDDGVDLVSVVAEDTGCYRFKIFSPDNKEGDYKLVVSQPTKASADDRDRVKAEWVFYEGNVLAEGPDINARRQAIADYKTALPVFERLKDARLGLLLKGLGYVYNYLFEYDLALKYLLRAQDLAPGYSDPTYLGEVLNNIGFTYDRLGEIGKAENYYEQALSHWQDPKIKNVQQEARTRINLGALYYVIGNYEEAIGHFRYIKERIGSAAQPDILYLAEMDLGRVSLARKEFDQALTHFNTAMQMFDNDLEKKRESLNSIAITLSDSGRVDEALKIVRELEPLYDQQPDNKRAQALRYNTLGGVLFDKGDYEHALDNLNRSLSIGAEINDPELVFKVLSNVARAQSALDRLPDARRSLEKAIALNDQFRLRVDAPSLRQTYFAAYHVVYEAYIDVLMRLHSKYPSAGLDKLALEQADQARARSLLDSLVEAKVSVDNRIPQGLLERRRIAQEQLDEAMFARAKLSAAKHTDREAVAADFLYQENLRNYNTVIAEIRDANPDFYNLVKPEILTVEQIRHDVLDDETAIIEYAVGTDRSYVWAITRKDFVCEQLPGREALQRLVTDLRDILTARACQKLNEAPDEKERRIRSADQEYPKISYKASRLLLGPVAPVIRNKRLAIVPDGPLHLIPFGALPDPESPEPRAGAIKVRTGSRSFLPLFVNHEIVSLPSANTLIKLRETADLRERASKTLAVIADPVSDIDDGRLRRVLKSRTLAELRVNQSVAVTRLPQLSRGLDCDPLVLRFARLKGFEEEGNAILSLVAPSRRKRSFGFNANKAALKRLGNYRFIHIAAHGYVPDKANEQGGVVLSQFDRRGNVLDRFLRLSDVYSLRLRPDLVTLSACDSGLGKDVQGEGIVSLARGFMYAGTPRVAVTLWKVEDEPTKQLMVKFYKLLLKTRRGVWAATALREAQKYLWESESYNEPFFWGAFIIEGEWR